MISRRILRIKVLQVLYAFFKSNNENINKTEKELFFSIQKTHDLYHYLLLLIIDVTNYASERIELAKQKNLPTKEEIHPNTKFIDNLVVDQLKKSKLLNKYLGERKLSWINSPELIKKIFLNIKNSDLYKEYINDDTKLYKKDNEFLIKVFAEIITSTDDLYQNLEEQSIYWNDEVDFVISNIIKTLKGFKEKDGENIKLLPLFKNEEDKEFAKTLFRKVVLNYKYYTELIEKYTENWEVERIAFMDMLILQMAIAEVIEFISIPTKVTFNEYLEISKYYSTKKSNVFINGVLDKIIIHLKENKKINKAGRGLIGEE